jgi:hypothetical protein
MTTTGRNETESIVSAAIWWVVERPLWLRVAAYGSVPLAAFVLATLSGSPVVDALRFAGLQAGVIGGAALVALGFRRLF